MSADSQSGDDILSQRPPSSSPPEVPGEGDLAAHQEAYGASRAQPEAAGGPGPPSWTTSPPAGGPGEVDPVAARLRAAGLLPPAPSSAGSLPAAKPSAGNPGAAGSCSSAAQPPSLGRQPAGAPGEGDLLARLQTAQSRSSASPSDLWSASPSPKMRPGSGPKGGGLMARLQAAEDQLAVRTSVEQRRRVLAWAGTPRHVPPQSAAAPAAPQQVVASSLAEHLASADQNLKKGASSSDSSQSEERDTALLRRHVAEEVVKLSGSSGSSGSEGSGSRKGKGKQQRVVEGSQSAEGSAQDNADLRTEVMTLKEKLRLSNLENYDNATLQLELKQSLEREAELNTDTNLTARKFALLEAIGEESTKKNRDLISAIAEMRSQKDKDDDAFNDLEDTIAGIYARHSAQLANQQAASDLERARDKTAAAKEQADALQEERLRRDEYAALLAENSKLLEQGKMDRDKLAALMAWSKTVQEDHKGQVTGLEDLLTAANAALAAEEARALARAGSKGEGYPPKAGAPAPSDSRSAVETADLRRQLADLHEKHRVAEDALLALRMQGTSGAGTGRGKAPSRPAASGRSERAAVHGQGSSRGRVVGGVSLRSQPRVAALPSIEEDDEVSSHGGAGSSNIPGADDVGNLNDLEDEEEEADAAGGSLSGLEEEEDAREPTVRSVQAEASASQLRNRELIEELQQSLLASQHEVAQLREDAADCTAQTGTKIKRLMEQLKLAREVKNLNQEEIYKLNQDAFDLAAQQTSKMEEVQQELSAAKRENLQMSEKMRSKARQRDIDYAKLQEDLKLALDGWRAADGRLKDFKEAVDLTDKERPLETPADGAAEPLTATVRSLQEKLQQTVRKYNLLENSIELKEVSWVTEQEELQRQHAMALADQAQTHRQAVCRYDAMVESLRQERDALRADLEQLQAERDELQRRSILSGATLKTREDEEEAEELAAMGRPAERQPPCGVCWQEVCWQLLAGVPELMAFQCTQGPKSCEIKRATAAAWKHWGSSGVQADGAELAGPPAVEPANESMLAEALADLQVAVVQEAQGPEALARDACILRSVGRKTFHSNLGSEVPADVVAMRLPAEPDQRQEAALLVVVCPKMGTAPA